MATIGFQTPLTADRILTLQLPATVQPGDKIVVRLTTPQIAQNVRRCIYHCITSARGRKIFRYAGKICMAIRSVRKSTYTL